MADDVDNLRIVSASEWQWPLKKRLYGEPTITQSSVCYLSYLPVSVWIVQQSISASQCTAYFPTWYISYSQLQLEREVEMMFWLLSYVTECMLSYCILLQCKKHYSLISHKNSTGRSNIWTAVVQRVQTEPRTVFRYYAATSPVWPFFSRTGLCLQNWVPNSDHWQGISYLSTMSHWQACMWTLPLISLLPHFLHTVSSVHHGAFLIIQAVTRDGFGCIRCPSGLIDEGKCKCPKGNILGK